MILHLACLLLPLAASIELYNITDQLPPDIYVPLKQDSYGIDLEQAGEFFIKVDSLFKSDIYMRKTGLHKCNGSDDRYSAFTRKMPHGLIVAATTSLPAEEQQIINEIWQGSSHRPADWLQKSPTSDRSILALSPYGEIEIIRIDDALMTAVRLYRPLPDGGYLYVENRDVADSHIGREDAPSGRKRILTAIYIRRPAEAPHTPETAITQIDIIYRIDLHGSTMPIGYHHIPDMPKALLDHMRATRHYFKMLRAPAERDFYDKVWENALYGR